MQKRAYVFSMPPDPALANFSMSIRFLPSGSLRKNPAEICAEIVAQLKNSGIDVLAVASDGRRLVQSVMIHSLRGIRTGFLLP
jgi:arginyl-tRNA synthetase